jgi:hypothetical protein
VASDGTAATLPSAPSAQAAAELDGLATLPPLALRVPLTAPVSPPSPVAVDRERELVALERARAELADRPAQSIDDRFIEVPDAVPSRFVDLTVDVGRRRALNPLRMSRVVALVAVAGHDAAVAAHRAGVVGTPLEEPDLPAVVAGGVDPAFFAAGPGVLPMEVVTASAQERVGCSVLPEECERFESLGRLAVERAVASGEVWPALIDAARALGAEVASSVGERAGSDGALPWSPGRPAAPAGGEWQPTPGLYAPASEPGAGAWMPWNLASGDQFVPPPPPATDSGEFRAAVDQVLDVGTNLTDSKLRVVRFWEMGPGTSTPPGYWVSEISSEQVRDLDVADQATALAVVATAVADAGISCWNAKYRYLTLRPVTAAAATGRSAWLPSIPTPPFPAYPSGHSEFSAAAAAVLAALVPDGASRFAAAAAEASDSRVRGGIHFWFDAVEGVRQGERVATAALERFGVRPVPVDVVAKMEFTNASAR